MGVGGVGRGRRQRSHLSARSWQMMFSTSTTPSACSCRQPMVVAMKQPVRPMPALQKQRMMGNWLRWSSQVGSLPAVDDDRAPGGRRRPSVRLHLGHQLQQREGGVGGLMVGPGGEPVMLQDASLIPTLQRSKVKG